MNEYEDIIKRQRPQSGRHKPMPRQDRAAQFSPFAALPGHEGILRETAVLNERQMELGEDLWLAEDWESGL